MGEHLIDGEFQSDKYPWSKRGFVPLKITDPNARKVLEEYAELRRPVDSEFADDLLEAIRIQDEKDGPSKPRHEIHEKTNEELRKLIAVGEMAAVEINNRHADESDKITERIKAYEKFEKEELIFAATAKCACGQKLAYPQNIGADGAWYCSGILMRTAVPNTSTNTVEHDEGKPFAFWKIKSERES